MISWQLLSQPGFQRLAVALVHFVWQGVLIAAVVAILMRRLSSREPHLRYGLLLAGMLLMAVSPLVTFCLTEAGPTGKSRTTPDAAVTAIRTGVRNRSETRPLPAPSGSVTAASPRRSATGASVLSVGKNSNSLHGAFGDWLTAARPWLLAAWLCGVLLLSARLVLGYAAVRWLMWSRKPVSRQLTQITRTMAQRIGLHPVPIVAGCERVADAMVVGFVRPMVLLPMAWCTQLSPDVLEAVIAHELAHVRRWDLWVNLVQRLIETALFYHPAVWWVSRRLRAERELCCDAVAVAATGKRLRYVEALATVASAGSHRTPRLLAAHMGGKQMALLNRVRHILGGKSRERRLSHWSAGVIVLAIPLGLWLTAATMIPAAADEADNPRTEPPETRRADRDRDRDRPAPPRFRDRDRDGRPGDRDRRHRDGFRGDHPRGDRPHGPRPEGDRPPRRGFGPRGERDGDRGFGPHGDRDRRPRDGRPGEPPGPEQLIRLIQELREEVQQLRREVRELREHRPPEFDRRGPDRDRRFRPPEGSRPARREGERSGPPRRDADGDRGPRRFGDRGPHHRPPFEGRGRRGDRRPPDEGHSRRRPSHREGERDDPSRPSPVVKH